MKKRTHPGPQEAYIQEGKHTVKSQVDIKLVAISHKERTKYVKRAREGRGYFYGMS